MVGSIQWRGRMGKRRCGESGKSRSTNGHQSRGRATFLAMNPQSAAAHLPSVEPPPALDRRAFVRGLARGGAAAAAALATTLAGHGAATVPPNLRWRTAVGLNGFESAARKYQKQFPLWEILDAVSNLGFDGIELVNGWPQGGYPKPTETDRVRALRRQYAGFGLQVFSIQTSSGDAFAPDAAVRRAWVEQFREWATLARELGCAHVGTWPGGGLRGLTIDQAIDYCAQSFREAGKIAGDLGLVAAFEIEPPFVFNTEDHLLRLLHGADHPALKTIYDPSHFDIMTGSKGRPHEMLQRVGLKNIGYVHLTDTDGTLRDGGTSKHLPVGDGHANIAESLRILREGGYRGWIMVDGWEIPDPYDAAAKAKRAMDAVG